MVDGIENKTVGIQMNREILANLEKDAAMWFYVNKAFQEMYDLAAANGLGGSFNNIIMKHEITQHFLTESLENASKRARKWVKIEDR